MTGTKIYEDIALRTGGDIYVGVVGPVRTGKSTFIKRFMETLVIPNIENEYVKERARDELPQSGSGRTIMTAEPKFIPEEAVSLTLAEGATMSVRLIDCVGYMVRGAAGLFEDGLERMVTTPWFDEEITMTRAAEEGTRRVICDHSSIGLMITTDGSICGIPREDYIEAEDRVVNEMKAIGKPFMILLNCQSPNSQKAKDLQKELSEKFGVACVAMNCLELSEADIQGLMSEMLMEFPIEEYSVIMPGWLEALPWEHKIKSQLISAIKTSICGLEKLKDAKFMLSSLGEIENVSTAKISSWHMGRGSFELTLELPQKLYYQTISQESGLEICCEGDLIKVLCQLSKIKAKYDKISSAMDDVMEKGYGVVLPSADEMVLQEPEIVRQGGRYSVMLRASAPAIHMLRTKVETEVSPALGGANASEEILGFLLQNFEGDASKIWETNIFGKSMYDIAGEGLAAKLKRLPDSAAHKLRGALQKMINEGSGGLICIIL